MPFIVSLGIPRFFAGPGLRTEGSPALRGCPRGVVRGGALVVASATGPGMCPERDQPWRCLWRRLSQITMTRPCRRITLHLSQIFFTLGLTFMTALCRSRGYL